MTKRLIVLAAAVALLLIGAVPVSAAPGGVPGPPPGHGKSEDKVVADEEPESEGDETGPPEWAKAYGKRIKDAYGIPFGQLQQCADVDDDGTEDLAPTGDAPAEDDVTKRLDACPADLEFPEGESGAKAFWVFTEAGALIVGT
jgi:hypothetical protein